MARPGVFEKISAATATAMARPDVKQRQSEGLRRRYASDPELRQRISEATKVGMANWRKRSIAAAATVLQQLPKSERAKALATLNAAFGTATGKPCV
jgi:hypothetical protein